MGTTIMARVKNRSFMMTWLFWARVSRQNVERKAFLCGIYRLIVVDVRAERKEGVVVWQRVVWDGRLT